MEEVRSQPRNVSSRFWLTASVLGAAVLVIAFVLTVSGERTASPEVHANLLVLTPAAFLAGLLSFLSPCTLPILPAYFAFSVQTHKNRTWSR